MILIELYCVLDFKIKIKIKIQEEILICRYIVLKLLKDVLIIEIFSYNLMRMKLYYFYFNYFYFNYSYEINFKLNIFNL